MPKEVDNRRVKVILNESPMLIEEWHESYLDWYWYSYYDADCRCKIPDSTAILAYKLIPIEST